MKAKAVKEKEEAEKAISNAEKATNEVTEALHEIKMKREEAEALLFINKAKAERILMMKKISQRIKTMSLRLKRFRVSGKWDIFLDLEVSKKNKKKKKMNILMMKKLDIP